MRHFCLLLLFTFGFVTKSMGNQEMIEGLRDNWHNFLPTALIQYPAANSVETYQLSTHIRVYEPANFERIVIWITGNAFIFDEPDSHNNFLRYFAEAKNCKIFALSHRKLPEFTYADIQNDIIDSIDHLSETKQCSDNIPVILAGDSSGGFLAIQLLPHFLNKTSLDQLFLIAPAFDMAVFLEGKIEIESFPKEAQSEVSNQFQLMKFIASLLYRNGERLENPVQAIKDLPKTKIICFEYDLFYHQALQFQKYFTNVTLDCKKRGYHCDYLLKSSGEKDVEHLLLSAW